MKTVYSRYLAAGKSPGHTHPGSAVYSAVAAVNGKRTLTTEMIVERKYLITNHKI